MKNNIKILLFSSADWELTARPIRSKIILNSWILLWPLCANRIPNFISCYFQKKWQTALYEKISDCVPITSDYFRKCLAFRRDNRFWINCQRKIVLLSDGSQFIQNIKSQRTFIWRKSEICYLLSNIRERDHYEPEVWWYKQQLRWMGTHLFMCFKNAMWLVLSIEKYFGNLSSYFRDSVSTHVVLICCNLCPDRTHLTEEFLEWKDIRLMD